MKRRLIHEVVVLRASSDPYSSGRTDVKFLDSDLRVRLRAHSTPVTAHVRTRDTAITTQSVHVVRAVNYSTTVVSLIARSWPCFLRWI